MFFLILGDKAKAKRLASKSAASSTFSTTGGNKLSPQIQPIAYLCCPTLANNDCIPGKLSLTQLLNSVQLATKRNVDFLTLKIEYAAPSGTFLCHFSISDFFLTNFFFRN